MKERKTKNYESAYAELPFENILREYRQQNIFKIMAALPHKRILEIGCGHEPLFRDFADFEKMVVVEPLKVFYETAKYLAGTDSRITIINGLFENIVQDLLPESFDFIVIGGFLHEINNPEEVLLAVKKVCNKNTIVHSFVPNANSFHRLVAYEMGIIKDVYEKSGHDEMFQRFNVFNIETFKLLFNKTGFSVKQCGTYFIKPGSHKQMQDMLENKVIDKAVLEGLNKMTKYFPENGAEIFINASVKKINAALKNSMAMVSSLLFYPSCFLLQQVVVA